MKLPEGQNIGIVEALTALAFGEYKTPERCKAEAIARLERWGLATNLPHLLSAFEARAHGGDGGDMGSLVDRLVARFDKPLATLAGELKREIADECDANLRIGSVERRILEAARTGRIKLIAVQNGKAPFLEIPARQFEYKMAVHLPSGSITVSYDASMEDHVHTADVTYERVRISRTCCSAVPFGGVCFIGLILVPFTVTMSRKPSVTQTAQSVLRALTGNMNGKMRQDSFFTNRRPLLPTLALDVSRGYFHLLISMLMR